MFKIYLAEASYNKVSANDVDKYAYLNKLLKQQPVQLLTEADNENLKTHPEEVLKNPSALYILDISPDEALGIRSKYGVMCLSSENPDVSPLIDVNDYFKPSTETIKFKGWDKVLDNIEMLPSNALILIDRYLFSLKNKDKSVGLNNVSKILDELLPKNFEGGDYHITIVFNFEAKHSDLPFKDIVSQLNDTVHQLRPDYNFMVEVFCVKETCCLYHDSHDRQIISNYYFVEASHQLAAFNDEDKGVVSQSITPWSLFTESSLNGDSSAPLETIEQTIKVFSKFYASIYNETKRETYYYGLNGKVMKQCMGAKNRLLR